MAYVAAAKARAEKVTQEDPNYKANPGAAETFVGKAISDASDYVNGETFRGGWIETIAKEGVPVAGAAEFFLVPKSVTDKGVEAILDLFEKKGPGILGRIAFQAREISINSLHRLFPRDRSRAPRPCGSKRTLRQ